MVGENRIKVMPPAVMKPQRLWTGKQLISNIIQIIVKLKGEDIIGLNMVGKSRLQQDYMGPQGKEESNVDFYILDNNKGQRTASGRYRQSLIRKYGVWTGARLF